MKNFEPVRLTFSKKNVPVLKEAMKKLCRDTMIRNTSIVFHEDGFEIIEPTQEHFLFQFGMYYGKLLEGVKL
jgi:hypothetical protein